MDVRIGVTYTPKEIEVEVSDDTNRDQLIATIEEAVSTEGRVLWLTDRRGRTRLQKRVLRDLKAHTDVKVNDVLFTDVAVQ